MLRRICLKFKFITVNEKQEKIHSMKSDQALIAVRDEVFRKIGRNLLNFQKIELMLKYIIANGQVSGPVSELKQIHERKIALVHKKMMGNLVGEFVENIFQLSSKSSNPIENLKEPYLSFSISVEADSDFYESKRHTLKLLVDDRNDFIHHLLPRFNLNSLECCLEVDKYLDKQRERLIPEYDYLKTIIDSISEHVDFLNSEEGKKQLNLSILQQSPLVALLLDVSVQKARSDGWTFLGTAGLEIRKILPGEIEQLKSKWGYEKLKDLLLASELFDIFEEPTEKDGTRVLYRSKPELAYSAYNRLIQSVLDISNKTASDDGWTPLNSAIQHVEELLSDEFAQVKAVWNYRSLKKIMIESNVFEIKELPETGEFNVFYKPKTE
jgi:hypothetical protein